MTGLIFQRFFDREIYGIYSFPDMEVFISFLSDDLRSFCHISFDKPEVIFLYEKCCVFLGIDPTLEQN